MCHPESLLSLLLRFVYFLVSRYARDNTTVILTGMSLVDNEVARGAVVFVADSYLETYQVRTAARIA